jgi:hypothetical protein
MTPKRFVVVDENTGIVINVVTIENGHASVFESQCAWYEHRTATLGDHYSNAIGTKRFFPEQLPSERRG